MELQCNFRVYSKSSTLIEDIYAISLSILANNANWFLPLCLERQIRHIDPVTWH